MITYDKYQRIKEIFHSAQDHHTPAERSAFLTEVCGDDTAMREELEALLTADAENDDFLIESAYEFAAGMLADERREFSPGQEVGQYRIECFLSSGGMGQIYEAHDTKLGRKIALKFISPEYAKDLRRVQRFEQEARAASALNHPNVCVIHDVGVTDNSRHFIAMEFIQGPTLRDELTRRTFRPLEALEIIIQVGDALASAHAKGIVHRDIKPENIMLRHDGYVKVVDFGLAKLTEPLPEQQHIGEVETRVLTEQHMIMGTVRYMSPEQLREAPVDERTDIWSLGIVLYEMLTGTTPFKARAPNESIALILSSQLQFNEEIPVQLRDILKKALEKDCAQRYQTITKLTADLRNLKRELDMNAERDFVPVREFQRPPVSDRRKKERTTGSEILTRLGSQVISTADTVFTGIRTHKTAAIFASVTSVLVLLFLAPVGMSWIDRLIGPGPDQWTVVKLTNDGKAICTAISPDDKWVAYAEDQNGKQRLVITNTINSGSSVAIPPDDVQYVGIAFSRNSNDLYFTRVEKGLGILYRLAWPGNNPIKLKEGVDSPISLSPQGDRFAYVHYDEKKAEFSLMLSDINGTNEQVVASRNNGRTLSTYGVAWSPDGNLIVCPVSERSKGWQTNLIAFDLKNGGEQRIGNQSWFSIQQVAWEQDMGLIISATTRLTSPHHLWQISFPEGNVQEITTDLSEYTSISLSSERIVAISTDRLWRIWVGALDNLQAMTEIARGSNLSYGLSWSSNGNIVFSSMTPEGLNIYRISSDGSHQVQLTAAAGDNYMPAASRDGRFIVFASNRSGSSNIWRMNADDGSNQTQLTHGHDDYYPSCSPDNKWIAYDNLSEWKAKVWKVPMAGGEAIKAAENYRMPAFSPDNQFLACRYDKVSGTRDVAIFPAQGGEPLRHFEVPRQDWQSVQFFQSSREASYVNNVAGYSNIWTYDLNTGTSKQLTNFNSEQIYAYAWSPDYKQIALLRGTKTNNVTIISRSER